ncbi:MAG: glycosyltransferase [Oligoflexales bacterium]|nr:glycosyltransferase [Oligoflexales bacterium]
MTKLSIVVPIYNERHFFQSFWNSLIETPISLIGSIQQVEIIIINDGSTDGILSEIDLKAKEVSLFDNTPVSLIVLNNSTNMGKGFSVRKGIDQSSGDYVIILDSDTEYSPKEIPHMLLPIIEHGADAVIGNRFIGPVVRVLYFWNSFANSILNLFCNILNNLRLGDFCSGYKAFRGDLIRNIKLTSNRFGIEAEIVSRLAQAQARIYEIPIEYNGRKYSEGKKIRALDGLLFFWHIVRYSVIDREPFKPGLFQTLTALEKVSNHIYLPLLNKAMEQAINKNNNLKILEVGSGIGSLTKELVKHGDVVATDISDSYVSILKTKFSKYTGFEAIQWDASLKPNFMSEKFDMIVSFNVLEHIQDDNKTMKIWADMLKPNGALIVLVPYSPQLFCPIDEAVGHFRRYTKKSLSNLFNQSGVSIRKVFFGNSIGTIGWIISGVIMQKSRLSTGQLKLYSLMKPFIKPVEKVLENYIGLSLIIVGQNPNNDL